MYDGEAEAEEAEAEAEDEDGDAATQSLFLVGRKDADAAVTHGIHLCQGRLDEPWGPIAIHALQETIVGSRASGRRSSYST